MSTEKNCIDCGCKDNTAPVMPPLGSGGDCPNPEPCSTITPAGCVVFTGNDKLCGEDTVYESGDRLPAILSSIVDYFCGRFQTDSIIPVSLSELQTLISDSELIGGRLYNITDRGIFLQALSNNTLSNEGSRVMRIVKNTYYVPSGTTLGVWYSGLTPSTGDTVVWGGRVWQNVAGNVGANVDDITLDSEWTLIATSNDTYYESKVFGCTYDLTNDWVSKQWDDRGNVFSYSYEYNQVSSVYPSNPIETSDWGDERVLQNKCFFIFNNTFSSLIEGNNVFGGVFNNIASGDISTNTNRGSISSNVCQSINFNSNAGAINSNLITGDIIYNTNSGRISFCENSGDIKYNTNNGIIANIGSANDNIQYNTNNGDITTTTTGDISDAIVNK
jgi:hypothetical protein